MDPLHRIEQRLTDLEVKACYTEDLVEDLNRLVARQQDQIDTLLRLSNAAAARRAGCETRPVRRLRLVAAAG